MSDTNYAESIILNYMFTTQTGAAIQRPTAWWVSLHTADPTETGAVAEVSGGAYTRVQATFGTSTGGSAITNNAIITYPTATANWGTVTHVTVWDSQTGGNALRSGALGASSPITTGVTFSIPVGQLSLGQD